MRKHMVTSAHASQLEAKPFSETTQISEGNVRNRSMREAGEELPLVHAFNRNPRLGWDSRIEVTSRPHWQGKLDALMTYDKQLAIGAREHGLEVLTPS
jgi:hypothetical protein